MFPTSKDLIFLKKLEVRYRHTLIDDVMPFWLKHSLDPEFGGYCSSLDRRGNVVDSDKAVWVQGRMAWMFFTLYNSIEPRTEWFDAGDLGLRFLNEHAFAEDGKMYFLLDRFGQPLRMRRHFFSEAFAAIASASAIRAGGRNTDNRAVRAFESFLAYAQGRKKLPAKWDPATRPMKSLATRMIAIVTAQCLREDIAYPGAETAIDWAVSEIRDHFVKAEHGAVMETVGLNGEIYDTFDGRQINPGHAFEAAWFLLKEGRHRNDGALKILALQIIDWMWDRGWDQEYGGLFYFRDVADKPQQEYWHDMKFWWPHNEAEIALLLAWIETGEERFRQRLEAIHDYQFQKFSDPEFGEWFGYLHRAGDRSSDLKGNHWKSAFHLPRMLFVNSLLAREAIQKQKGNP